ncbi:hypothetical protein [Campylobacter lanienae]|nr:hypothetical protein [Campylobacter lanienae]MDY5519426.1 hypothetical protein [Campylobacter lanienae]
MNNSEIQNLKDDVQSTSFYILDLIHLPRQKPRYNRYKSKMSKS